MRQIRPAIDSKIAQKWRKRMRSSADSGFKKERSCTARNSGTIPAISIVSPPARKRRRESTDPAIPAMEAGTSTNVRIRNPEAWLPPKIKATTLRMKFRGVINRPRIPPMSPRTN